MIFAVDDLTVAYGSHVTGRHRRRRCPAAAKARMGVQLQATSFPSQLPIRETVRLCAGLDPRSRRQLWARIDHLRPHGGSIVLTTLSKEEAQAVCDRVAIVDHGRLLTEATPAELIDQHRDDPRVLQVAHGPIVLTNNHRALLLSLFAAIGIRWFRWDPR